MATDAERAEAPKDPKQFFDFSSAPDFVTTASGIKIRVIKTLDPAPPPPPVASQASFAPSVEDDVEIVTSTPLDSSGDLLPIINSPGFSQIPHIGDSSQVIEMIHHRIRRLDEDLAKISEGRMSVSNKNRDRLRADLQALKDRLNNMSLQSPRPSLRSPPEDDILLVKQVVVPKVRPSKAFEIVASTSDEESVVGGDGRKRTARRENLNAFTISETLFPKRKVRKDKRDPINNS